MWPFSNKKSLVDQDIFKGFTDNHSHILPGVDDGVKTQKESLAILSTYEQMGVKEVWLTPHIQEYMPNTTEELQERFEELQSAYNGTIQLHLAAEYMIDSLFIERLEANDLLLHGKDKDCLLVETSYLNPPLELKNTLMSIKLKGITPILAHPERYVYMNKEDYKDLKQMDILFQLNIGSFLGIYGKDAEKKAQYLLSQDYYDLTGTDIHSHSLISYFQQKKTKKITLPQP